MIVLAILLLIIGLGSAAYFLIGKDEPSPEAKPATIETQELGPNAIKQLNDINAITGSLQTLNIAPNAVFKNNASVQGDTELERSLSVNGSLLVRGTSDLQGTVSTGALNVRRSLTVTETANFGSSLQVAGPLSASSVTTNNLTVNGAFSFSGHLAVGGPPISARSSVAIGGGGSVVINGNDTSGTITINTGSGPFAGELAIATFRNAFPGTPKVLLTPVGSSGAKLEYFVTRSTSFFTVNAANAPTPNTSYNFDYFVIQ